MKSRPQKTGFTLIELMLVVAVMGILAAISVPKMATLIARAKDARTKGNLGALRSAIAIYFGENEGHYPSFPFPFSQPAQYGPLLKNSLVPRYISAIPIASPSGGKHRASNAVMLVWNLAGNQDNEPTSGHGWTYDANPWDELKPIEARGLWGTIRVLCRHTDSRGNNWSSF